MREESHQELLQAIEVGGEVKRLRGFSADAEMEAKRRGPEELERVTARIALARELVGEPDALGALLAWKCPAER